MTKKRWSFGRIVLVLVILVVVMQLVPYGRNHTNPPVVSEPNWDSPDTRALYKQYCFDCHSNETVWPWYSQIAPASWLVQRDVNEGRQKLNFSDLTFAGRKWAEVAEVLQEGEMPPPQYTIIHGKPDAAQLEKMIALAQALSE